MFLTVISFTRKIRKVLKFLKQHWAMLVEKGYVWKTLGLGKTDYGNASIFYAWF